VPRTRRHLASFAALSGTYFAHIGFFNPYLPLWLKDMGLGLVAISLLTSVQSATRLLAPYGWGWLSDHTGERVKLLRFGATAALLLSFGLWWPGGAWWIALVLFLMFLNTSAMMSMSEAAMAHLVSAGGSFDAKRYGRVRLWGSLGFLVTVFAAGAWFEHFGMQHFPAWTVLSLLAVVVSVWCLPDLKEAVPTHAAKPPILPILRKRPVQWFFASVFFHILSHMSVYAFFSLYLDALGYSKTMIGLLWGISVVAEIVWFFTQSRWLPMMRLSAWLVLCGAVMVVRMGLTAAGAQWLVLLVLAQCLHAFTFAAHHAVCVALLSHHFPGQLRGRGQALYAMLGYGLTGVLGGAVGGLLSAQLGLESVFWATLGTSVLATLCAWRGWRLPH
jgi:PPP family 3-phenylpropionic acid transporter